MREERTLQYLVTESSTKAIFGKQAYWLEKVK